MKFSLVIGNPPYGNAGRDAISFLNKSGDITEQIRYVLPRSIVKESARRRIRTDLECIETHQLPDDTFPKGIHTVKETWVAGSREVLRNETSHPDFVFLKKGDSDVNVAVMRLGYAGLVMTNPKRYEHLSEHHFYLHCSEVVVERMKECQEEWGRVSQDTNGIAVLPKSLMVRIYNEIHGDVNKGVFTDVS